jgi:tetratricopeptide (TPR) repeat protein
VLQAWDFAPGDNFVAKMQEASERAQRTLAVLSPDYLQSRFSREEWTAALAGRKLLPVRVREVDLGGILAVQVYIDLVGLPEDEARERLVEQLERKGRLKPSGKPRFPAGEPRFPGALPEIWNVPPIRNPNFTGRDTDLVTLQTELAQHHVVALTGLGGVGKSQLAVQLAHRCAPQLDIVWWVTAEHPETLVRDLAALAEHVGLGSSDEPAAAESARRHLERRGRWLLVLDNAAEPASVREWIPQGHVGWTLITSRHDAWRGVATRERIDPLDVGAAASLLERRSGQHDPAGSRALADRLGGLPLALEQVGAYLDVTGLSLAEYVGLFDDRAHELLARGVDPEVPTVATVWELSFQRLAERSAHAADLLILSAFLAPDHIPRALLVGAEITTGRLKPLTDPIAFADAVAALAEFSLVTPVEDAFSVHRLVQDVSLARLDAGERQRWIERTVRLLYIRFEYDENDPTTWEFAGRLLPHALRACEGFEPDIAPDLTARVLYGAATYLLRRADYSRAQQAAERAVQRAEIASGPESGLVASCLNLLGQVLQSQGDRESARSAVTRALAIDERLYGPDHHSVAADLNSLGDLDRESGDLASAQSAFERALAIDEAAFGPDAPILANRLNNLGLVLRQRGDLDAAEATFLRGLRITEASFGPDHPTVSIQVSNLGGVRLDRRDFDGAQAAYERALTIDRDAHGADHPNVGIRLNNLGRVFDLRGETDKAVNAYKQSLAIMENALGPEHWRTAIARKNLAHVLARVTRQ